MPVGPDSIKVLANLEVDEDGWPPFAAETFWCTAEPGGYRVDNIPYFLAGVSVEDLIEAEPDGDGLLTFRRVLDESANSTVWIVFFDVAVQQGCLDGLAELGCGYDGEPLKGYFALNVPPVVPLGAIDDLLRPLIARGAAEVAFPTIRHPSKPSPRPSTGSG